MKVNDIVLNIKTYAVRFIGRRRFIICMNAQAVSRNVASKTPSRRRDLLIKCLKKLRKRRGDTRNLISSPVSRFDVRQPGRNVVILRPFDRLVCEVK